MSPHDHTHDHGHPHDHSHPHRHSHDHTHSEGEEFCPVIGGTPIDVAKVRGFFPFFRERAGAIPFNNAATTLVPETGIHLVEHYLHSETASPGRGGLDSLSTGITGRIEETRTRVAKFIGASPEDVAFTSGATASLNMVALAWGLKNLRNGDEIMLCLQDHKSTVLPWLNLQRLLRSFGVKIRIVPIHLHQMGNYELQQIENAKTDRTRLLAMTHVHHVYGLNMEVKEVREIVGDSVLISLDAAQSVGHRPVNIKDLPVDFLSFSGHKMFGLNGVGVLWVAPRLRGELQAPIVGGGMHPEGELAELRLPSNTLAQLIEAGTPNIPAILSMGPAIDIIERIGMDIIEGRIKELMKHMYLSLRKIPGLEFSPGVDQCWHQSHGILSFRVEGVPTSDLGFVMGEANILVRAGDHCVYRKPDGEDYLRVSLHVYNTETEVDSFVEALKGALA